VSIAEAMGLTDCRYGFGSGIDGRRVKKTE